MKKKNTHIFFFLLLCLIVLIPFLQSCGKNVEKQDLVYEGYKGYALAVTAMRAAVEDYSLVKKQQTPEIQAKWKKEVEPSIHTARKALRAWEIALEAGSGDLAKQQFDQMFLELTNILLDIGVLQMKEEPNLSMLTNPIQRE